MIIRTYPNIIKRTLATFIDYVVYCTFWVAYVYNFGYLNEEGGYTVSGLMTFPLTVFWFLYFPVVESLKGQTLGHLVAGLQIVSVSGAPATFIQTFKRRILDPLDLFPFFGLIAFITIKNTEKNQRVGDLFAKTIVVSCKKAICEHCDEKLTLSPKDVLPVSSIVQLVIGRIKFRAR